MFRAGVFFAIQPNKSRWGGKCYPSLTARANRRQQQLPTPTEIHVSLQCYNTQCYNTNTYAWGGE